MLALAASGADEGMWLRAERQVSGRGRQGRAWVSPVGNLSASTIVRLRAGDPPGATLALVAADALEEAVGFYLCDPVKHGVTPDLFRGPLENKRGSSEFGAAVAPRWTPEQVRGDGSLSRPTLKWPNDLLIDGAKLSGILLERAGDAVVIGIGVNLAHHPHDLDRPATSLAAHGVTPDPADFLETLAEAFARWLARWRGEGLAPVRARWLDRAHPIGTALTARLPDGGAIDGLFNGLDADGALILRLADGGTRVIHAGDVFLI